jgi:integral membrane protein
MANVIGVCLIVLVCIGVPLEYLTTVGTKPQRAGSDIDLWVGMVHGMVLYPAFLIIAAVLSRWARWSITFTVVTLVLGTVPFLSFAAERVATRRVVTDYPELAVAEAT